METPDSLPLLVPSTPQRISIPEALGFNTTPSRDNAELLDYAIRHIFVPPKLPNRADGTPHLESALLGLVRDCAEGFKDRIEPGSDAHAGWEMICTMLATSTQLHGGELTEDSVKTAISSMGPGDVLSIHVAAQNAAIILRRPIIDPAVFTLESFEVLPSPKAVTHTEGKLRITYPSVGRLSAPAISAVYTSLAEFIAYYAQNVMADAKSQRVVKRGSTEDPPSPKYITELLTGIIRGMSPNPEETFRQTTFITKRIDDHALCDKDANAPWRRSPVWLMLRVTLQTTLHDLNLDERFSYKAFILYTLSSILSTALSFQQPDYLLFFMNAKLARRVWKLSHANVIQDGLFAIDTAFYINTLVSDELEQRWKRIQQETTRKVNWEVPAGQELMAAARMKLSQSLSNLKKAKKTGVAVQNRVGSTEWVVPGGKDYATRSGCAPSSPVDLEVPSTLGKMSPALLERKIQLYDFEVWVANKLRVIDLEQIDMIKLNKALNDYIDTSLTHYKGNPERLSVAFLTILEIWMTIDRKAIDWMPKLKHYPPEIPVNVLEPLLLPFRRQMERLSQVENYLEQRQREGGGKSAIFYDTTDRESFASWFVGQSASLRTTLYEMEQEAEKQTRQKEAEMEAMNAKHRALKQEMDAAVCTKQQINKMVTKHPACTKCLRKKEMEQMRFTVFERLLPADNIPRKCVIFELHTPHQFAIWRDATYAVLSACSGGIKEKRDGKPLLISSYPRYKSRFCRPYEGHKLELASHRSKYDNTRKPPLLHDAVIKPHSMSKYRVLNDGLWVSNPFSSDSETAFQYLRGLCAMEVTPDGPYKTLQFSVSGTTHTSNQIIASQDACSTTITLHDYEAFGHLRAGRKLQWRNMLKELRRGILSISHKDVHVLFLQALWQAEAKSKRNAWRREVHADAAEPAFGSEALKEMNELLDKIEDNWTWSYTCGTLIAMAARILSLTNERDVQNAAVTFLKRARGVAHRWLKEITGAQGRNVVDDTDVAIKSSAEASRQKQRQILLVALVCCSTFNIDESLIDRVFDSARDISLIVECRNLIYMNKPPTLSSLPFVLRALFDRDQLLALRLLPRLAECIRTQPEARNGLDEGIRALWDSYTPSTKWLVYNSPYERWYTTRTAEEGGLRGIDVHFNLLDGALYVDHTMFGKLPDAYTQHPTFLRLFSGFGVLETGPSTMPGMDYQTKRLVSGWQVHFAIKGKELVIRCRRDDEEFELIPDSKLTSVLPRSLVRDSTHWYNTSTCVTEIRPLSDPWTPNLEGNWSSVSQLNGAPALSRQRKSGHRQFIVDPNHPISRAIHKVFAPLEPSIFDLLITFNHGPSSNLQSQNLVISLPRYSLVFALTEQGDLDCLSHRGYLVDPIQDVGTLYGLSNMLVLRSRSGSGHKRRLILPVGSIRSSSDGNTHPNVTIDIQSDATTVKYHIYEVDELLGRLRDNTLLSRLYRLYLHSLTSHQLVDPLLQRTGTEEALQGLAQGETFSFQTLLPEEVVLLREIGQLTPVRCLYSKQTNSLETVQWDTTLPPTSEHYGFAAAVRKVWDYWMSIRVFHLAPCIPKEADQDSSFSPEYEEQTHQQLTRRSAFRNILYVHTQSSDYNTTASLGKDKVYVARDCLMAQGSIDREATVFEMSKYTHEWNGGLDVTTQLSDDIKQWGQISARQPQLSLNYCSALVGEPLDSMWRSLYELCRHASKDDQNRLAFVLATIAYHTPNQRQLCTTLLAFATHSVFKHSLHDSPNSGSLDFSYGETPTDSQLNSLITANVVPFEDSEEYEELLRTGRTRVREQAMRSQYGSHLQQDIDGCSADMIWLREQDHIPPSALARFSLLRKSTLQEKLSTLFKHCSQNRAFFQHLDSLQAELAQIRTPATANHKFPWDQQFPLLPPEHHPLVTWSMLFQRAACFADPRPATDRPVPNFVTATSMTGSNLEQHYATLLHASGIAYTEYLQSGQSGTAMSLDVEAETVYRTSALQEVTNDIKSLIGPRAENEHMLARSGLWPRISPRNLLERLTISQRDLLSASWKAKLLDYAQAIAMVQRARRLSELSSPERLAEYEREASNDGQSGWDALENPDWLLVELESNLLIRQVQAEIAMEMLEPGSKQNSVMQLNMGEGKSSVIVPIVAAALADRSRLTRVIVLKPLARQMFRLLCRTLGGLTNRRIFYLPLDRSLRPNPGLSKKIRGLFVECMEVGGILLCQPEHILSFKLMALETLSTSPSSSLSQSLLRTQRWLEGHARDILDESDEILSPKYQLIYTVGTQHTPDGDSMRWKLVQEVFDLIRACTCDERYKDSLFVDGSPPRFPQVRIFTQECGEHLLEKVAEYIVFWDLAPSFSFRRFSREDRQNLFRFITERAIDDITYNRVMDICENQNTLDNLTILKPILLLRGLIGHGVLLTILKEKRWRVDYGLDVSRSMLAVPYRAKDSPSPRAEFAHTDIAISLTCLTYYYEGLTDTQLEVCFEQLFKSDNPDQEYEEWIKDCRESLSPTLQYLRGLNLEDPVQRNEHIFPQLRQCKAVIDFFLSTIVFPRHMKEFPHKLSTSGWDLAQDRSSFGQLVTGFSGTNDNRFLLPLMIKQVDTEAHLHTNAMVLHYLKRKENSKVLHLPSGATSIRGMLERLRNEEPETRVLLDVGAQVLELQNQGVAELWLEVDVRPDIEAAVFVDPKDDLRVLRRDGSVELLVSSPYLEQLDRCVVYLDEAHTRGTDLKLPPSSRAAVTLGPRLCKDKLVQGCMRMRMLGSTHSIFFLASTEIIGYITAATGIMSSNITSKDVVDWSIKETLTQLRTYMSLWANQGFNFDDRNAAWEIYKRGVMPIDKFTQILKEKESHALEDLYTVVHVDQKHDQGNLVGLKREIQRRYEEFGLSHSGSARMQEEQEREVAQEKEEERQSKRPPAAVPRAHSLHRDVKLLVSTGVTPRKSLAILPAVYCLSQTTLGHFFKTSGRGAFSHIWVTNDFVRTIDKTHGAKSTTLLDDFLRPVEWILSSTKQPHLVLLSPFEANALIEDIRQSKFVTLHTYGARTSRMMRSFEDLRSFMVPLRETLPPFPSKVINELNLFSGQLYFRTVSAYEETCSMLGLYLKELPEDLDCYSGAIGVTGFVRGSEARAALALQGALFSDNPVEFLKKFIGLRRRGQGFLPTHLGQVLHARELYEIEFT